MFIRFRVKNFLSFKDEVELSMIAGKTRQHPTQVISGGESRYAVDLLRGAVIYGANASGKSNLVKAIAFARDLIVEGTRANQPIRTRPFRLDPQTGQGPSTFEFEIRVNQVDYLYGFTVSSTQVESEWLYQLKLTTQEMLFERTTTPERKTEITFGNLKFSTRKEADFLEFVGMGTRPNQLFLTECEDKSVAQFQSVLDWFKNTLVIIFPDTRFQLHENQEKDLDQIGRYLRGLGTGIDGLEIHPATGFDQFPEEFIHQLEDTLRNAPDQKAHVSITSSRGERTLLSLNESGELISHVLFFRHSGSDPKEEVLFETHDESDGSIRLLDLLPILYLGETQPKVFVIDELDRSLHPKICEQLLHLFLDRESDHTQLLVTTHESNLLSFDLLRRDEIWFTEKDSQGATRLYSLEEFVPRYDQDIQKGYLFGRFGAVPVIHS